MRTRRGGERSLGATYTQATRDKVDHASGLKAAYTWSEQAGNKTVAHPLTGFSHRLVTLV